MTCELFRPDFMLIQKKKIRLSKDFLEKVVDELNNINNCINKQDGNIKQIKQ